MLSKSIAEKRENSKNNLQISVSVKHLVFIRFCCWCCCCCDISGWRCRFNSSDRASQLNFINGVVVVIFKPGVGQREKVRWVDLSLVEAPWWWTRDGFASGSRGILEEGRCRRRVKAVKNRVVSRFVGRRSRVKIRAVVDPLMGSSRIRHDLRNAVRAAATRRPLQRQIIVGDAARIPASRSASIFLFKRKRNERNLVDSVWISLNQFRTSLKSVWISLN